MFSAWSSLALLPVFASTRKVLLQIRTLTGMSTRQWTIIWPFSSTSASRAGSVLIFVLVMVVMRDMNLPGWYSVFAIRFSYYKMYFTTHSQSLHSEWEYIRESRWFGLLDALPHYFTTVGSVLVGAGRGWIAARKLWMLMQIYKALVCCQGGAKNILTSSDKVFSGSRY